MSGTKFDLSEREPQTMHALTSELNDLCQRAHFRHRGFRLWPMFHHSMTAAIMGFFAHMRYILFTKRLIEKAPNRMIVAILGHEIGHSKHFHLLFYPFILLGMTFFPAFILSLIYLALNSNHLIFDPHAYFFHMIVFAFFAIGAALYFRFIFGYFSRLFERQADLYTFKLKIPPQDLIDALDLLAKESGNIHREPNWHHYSIQERIDYMKKAQHDPSLVARHSTFVFVNLILYFTTLISSVMLLFYLDP